jgi:hypothetical protein
MTEKKRQRKLKMAARLESELRLLVRRDPNAGQSTLFQKHYRPFYKEILAIEGDDVCQTCGGEGIDPSDGGSCRWCQGEGRYHDVDHFAIDRIMDEGFEVACQKAADEARELIAQARRGL